MYRRNATEQSIRNFKKYFKAGLATTEEFFPMQLWCRLLPQACNTLNLMRHSRMNPKISAETQLNGAFDYNHTPLELTGYKAVIHDNT